VTVKSYHGGSGEDPRRIKQITFKPYERYHALDKLAQYLGPFKGTVFLSPILDAPSALFGRLAFEGQVAFPFQC
jgi:hypothetical protein